MRTLALAALITLAVGCQSKPKPMPMPMAPSADQAAMIRDSFAKASPGAKFGTVTTVLESDTYVFVSEMPEGAVKPGDYVSFIDAAQATIASGKVVDLRDGKVAVMYTAVSRAPVVGDVVVKF